MLADQALYFFSFCAHIFNSQKSLTSTKRSFISSFIYPFIHSSYSKCLRLTIGDKWRQGLFNNCLKFRAGHRPQLVRVLVYHAQNVMPQHCVNWARWDMPV